MLLCIVIIIKTDCWPTTHTHTHFFSHHTHTHIPYASPATHMQHRYIVLAAFFFSIALCLFGDAAAAGSWPAQETVTTRVGPISIKPLDKARGFVDFAKPTEDNFAWTEVHIHLVDEQGRKVPSEEVYNHHTVVGTFNKSSIMCRYQCSSQQQQLFFFQISFLHHISQGSQMALRSQRHRLLPQVVTLRPSFCPTRLPTKCLRANAGNLIYIF